MQVLEVSPVSAHSDVHATGRSPCQLHAAVDRIMQQSRIDSDLRH